MSSHSDSPMIGTELTITLTAGEVASLIEACVDALYKRLQWSVRLDSSWREVDIAFAAQFINDLEHAYTKLYLDFRTLGQIHDDFEEALTIPDDVYELIDTITGASGWDEVPTHRHAASLCRLCRTIYRIPT